VEELHAASQHVSVLTASSTKQRTDTSVGGGGSGGLESSVVNSSSLPSLKTPLEHDTEKAQFLMKLAPRIRRLESDTIRGLSQRMEAILQEIQERRRQKQQEQETAVADGGDGVGAAVDITSSNSTDSAVQSLASTASSGGGGGHASAPLVEKRTSSDSDLLLMLGHCMRGLALLGRGKEVESIFARVAIMPLIRSKLSMGRLDEGGARGECAGLASLLQEMVSTIQETFGPVLCLAEAMFNVAGDTQINNNSTNSRLTMDVDLLTAGVWVPIATALMADAAIKMAIFSPGIASILQANYMTLDVFLSELAEQLLQEDSSVSVVTTEEDEEDYHLFYRPSISMERIQQAQDRIYTHAKTSEFSKRWNLPIYYQLRFGECCTRLNKSVDQTKREGWIAQVFSGSEQQAETIKHQMGFELSLFLELYDILLGLWRPDVILRPLTNRFLRGAVQMIGRVVSFISDSMEGKIKFGEEPAPPPQPQPTENGGGGGGGESSAAAAAAAATTTTMPYLSARRSYCWGESEEDVSAVAWELTILESAIQHDYVDIVCQALAPAGSRNKSHTSSTEKLPPEQDNELRQLITEVLQESAEKIHPIIDKAWNEIIVQILTTKCSSPLAAVKGVAATYRMTNRPPPTLASPFVTTILRPLREFAQEYLHRTPDRIGSQWKQQIVVTISDRYATAVQELLTTVQRTEDALKSRKTTTQQRRSGLTGGGAGAAMSDGEKVKLQVYLDFVTFRQSVREVGVDPGTVIGISKLQDLTSEGESLQERLQENAK
jgi:conserved oligomeric Golgi complex subunit 2